MRPNNYWLDWANRSLEGCGLLRPPGKKLGLSRRLDDGVEGVCKGLGLVHLLAVVALESNLTAVGPHRLDSNVLGQ
jgi:hypothetical protein